MLDIPRGEPLLLYESLEIILPPPPSRDLLGKLPSVSFTVPAQSSRGEVVQAQRHFPLLTWESFFCFCFRFHACSAFVCESSVRDFVPLLSASLQLAALISQGGVTWHLGAWQNCVAPVVSLHPHEDCLLQSGLESNLLRIVDSAGKVRFAFSASENPPVSHYGKGKRA